MAGIFQPTGIGPAFWGEAYDSLTYHCGDFFLAHATATASARTTRRHTPSLRARRANAGKGMRRWR